MLCHWQRKQQALCISSQETPLAALNADLQEKISKCAASGCANDSFVTVTLYAVRPANESEA